MKYSMYSVLALVIFVGIIFIACSDDDDSKVTANGDSQTYADSVWISDVTISEGDQAVVAVNFSNSLNVIRIEVPLKVYGSGFLIDSVSFVGGRIPTEALQLVKIDTAGQWVRTLWNGGPNISPGTGLFANMYITTEAGTSGGSLTVDSVSIGTYPDTYFMYYIKSTGSIIYPGFSGGTVTIN
jgi:hypothetical protein